MQHPSFYVAGSEEHLSSMFRTLLDEQLDSRKYRGQLSSTDAEIIVNAFKVALRTTANKASVTTIFTVLSQS